MPAVSNAEINALERVKNAVPPQLAKYCFQPGHPAPARAGRPKGVKNAQTILLKTAPKLAQAYVKEALKGNASVLVDSRKWILPVDEDAPAEGGVQIVLLTATSSARLQSPSGDSSETPVLPTQSIPSLPATESPPLLPASSATTPATSE